MRRALSFVLVRLEPGVDARAAQLEGVFRRLPVALLVDDVAVVVLRLLAGAPDHQVAAREDVAQLSGRRGVAEEFELLLQVFVLGRHGGEQAIGVVRGELAAGLRIARAHQDRPAAPPGLRLSEHGLQFVVLAVVVERLVLRPDALDDLDPFLGVVVAAVVIAERDAHHAELDRVPARDDVEAEAAVADVVGGHHLLGGEGRIDEGDVQRAEGRDLPRRGEQPGGPHQRLEGRALGVALALVSVPAADRQQELEPGVVGELRRLDVVVPGGVPALGRLGQAQAALAVHAEQPELELVLVVDPGFVSVSCHVRAPFRRAELDCHLAVPRQQMEHRADRRHQQHP